MVLSSGPEEAFGVDIGLGVVSVPTDSKGARATSV